MWWIESSPTPLLILVEFFFHFGGFFFEKFRGVPLTVSIHPKLHVV